MPRQQRTPGLRRTLGVRTTSEFSTVDWLPAAYTATGIRFSLWPANAQYQDTTRDYVLQGIPRMFLSTYAQPAIAAAWNKPYLDLDWGVPTDDTMQLTLAPNDPAFRGPMGEYLSGKHIIGVIPPPVPVDSSPTVGTPVGMDVQLSSMSGPATLALRNFPVISNDTQFIGATAVWTDGGTIYATFGSPAASGDQISWGTDPANWLNDTGGTLAPGSLILP